MYQQAARLRLSRCPVACCVCVRKDDVSAGIDPSAPPHRLAFGHRPAGCSELYFLPSLPSLLSFMHHLAGPGFH